MPLFAVYYDDGSTAVYYGTKPFTAPIPSGLEARVVSEIATSSEVFVPFAPALALASAFAGRVLTIDVDTLEGFPAPVLTVHVAEVDSVDVSGAVVETGTGAAFSAEYTFIDSVDDLPYTFTLRATNAVDFDPQTISGTVLGNLPLPLLAPTLTGGTGTLDLSFADVAGNSTRGIVGYFYEITLAADTLFAAPVYTGTLGSVVTVELTGVAAGDYIGRVLASNMLDDGDFSPASASATVT